MLEVALQQTMFNMPSQPLLRVCTLDLVEGEGDARLQVLESLAAEGGSASPTEAAALAADSVAPARLAAER
ncbi:hypothetical protein D3C85_1536520 [compost metagenome]